MSNHSENNNNTPQWILILFGAVVILSIGYAAFTQIFNSSSLETQFHTSLNKNVVKAEVEVVPVRDAAAIAAGEKVYKSTCSACHGMNLEGGLGPNLKDAQWYHGPASETRLVEIVSKGVSAAEAKGPNKAAMPSWKQSLGSEKIWQVVYYIGSKNPGVRKDSPAQ